MRNLGLFTKIPSQTNRGKAAVGRAIHSKSSQHSTLLRAAVGFPFMSLTRKDSVKD